MALYSCVLTCPTPAAPGVQTITGVVDAQTGTPFAGTWFCFLGGYVPLNTLGTMGPAPFYGSWLWELGVALGTTMGGSAAAGDSYQSGSPGFVYNGGGAGAGYCLVDYLSYPAGAGEIDGRAYITNIAVGSFQLTWDLRTRTGDSLMVLVLGGDELTVAVFSPSTLANASYATPSPAAGILCLGETNLYGSTGALNAVTGAGGGYLNLGWDTRGSGRGCAVMVPAYQVTQTTPPQYRAQLTDRCFTHVNSSGALVGGAPVVSAWGPTSYTVSGQATGGAQLSQHAFCGPTLVCAAGAFQAPATNGPVTITTGVHARAVLVMTTGLAPTTSASSGLMQLSLGWTDGHQQAAFWVADATPPGSTAKPTGARYLSTTSLARTGTPNGTSTTFANILALQSLTPQGSLTVTCTGADGTQPQILWFALGTAAEPPAPPAVRGIRRQRRVPLPFAQHRLMRVDRLEVLMQMGMGTSAPFRTDLPWLATQQAPDPVVLLRLSKDGGFTWGNEITLQVGKVGEYLRRCYVNRLGDGRQWVLELSMTDPVYSAWLDALVDVQDGVH